MWVGCILAHFSLNLIAEEENHMGWFCVEDDGNHIKKEKHPLLVGHMPVMVAKQQEFKVKGAGPAARGGVHLAALTGPPGG